MTDESAEDEVPDLSEFESSVEGISEVADAMNNILEDTVTDALLDFNEKFSESMKKAGFRSKDCPECENEQMWGREEGFYCPVCDYE